MCRLQFAKDCPHIGPDLMKRQIVGNRARATNQNPKDTWLMPEQNHARGMIIQVKQKQGAVFLITLQENIKLPNMLINPPQRPLFSLQLNPSPIHIIVSNTSPPLLEQQLSSLLSPLCNVRSPMSYSRSIPPYPSFRNQ